MRVRSDTDTLAGRVIVLGLETDGTVSESVQLYYRRHKAPQGACVPTYIYYLGTASQCWSARPQRLVYCCSLRFNRSSAAVLATSRNTGTPPLLVARGYSAQWMLD